MSEQPISVPNSVAHHWIMTVQFPDGTVKTYNDTLMPHPGVTRSDVFATLVNWIKEQRGVGALAVLYFDLAPNELPGGAR